MMRSLFPSSARRAFVAVGLLVMAACTGTPPDTDGAAHPPPPIDADEPEAATVDPKAEPEVVAPTPPPDPWGPITEDQRAVMLAGDEEERITTPLHYVQTNERRHDVWFPYLADKRGIY